MTVFLILIYYGVNRKDRTISLRIKGKRHLHLVGTRLNFTRARTRDIIPKPLVKLNPSPQNARAISLNTS